MLDHTSGESVMLDINIKPGAIWWATNNVDSQAKTNILKKNRPILIISVTQGYSSYKITGIMLQSRNHSDTSKYEHIIDRLEDGRYSIADVSNITSVDIESLQNYKYSVDERTLRIIRGLISDFTNQNNEKKFGQVWQYDNKDYLIYKIGKNPITGKEKVTIVPIVEKLKESVDICDIIIGAIDKNNTDKVKVVTVGTEILKDSSELHIYKYAVSDISVGKINEGFNKVNDMRELFDNPIMNQLGKLIGKTDNLTTIKNDTDKVSVNKSSHIKVDHSKFNKPEKRERPRYTRK